MDAQHPTLHVSAHPLVAHKLAILRDTGTDTKKFRELVRELTWLLGYEAMADLATRGRRVHTPLEETDGAEVDRRRSAWCRSCAPGSAWSTPCWS